jgi:hypothetical protein
MFPNSGFVGIGSGLAQLFARNPQQSTQALFGTPNFTGATNNSFFNFGLTDKLLFTIFITTVSVFIVKSIVK